MPRMCSRRVVAMGLVWLAVTCGVYAAPTVIVKPNPKDPAAGDVYLKTSATKAIKLRTVSNAITHHYHPAEYKNGSLYIIKRLGDENGVWVDELWRYGKNDNGTKLFSAQGLDFRVRDDGGLTAVVAPVKKGANKQSLYLLRRDAKLVKEFRPGQLGSTDIDFLKWNWTGQDLWLRNQEAVEIFGFVKIDTSSMKVDKYDILKLGLANPDYDLNIKTLRLAYSDYPALFDNESERSFKKRGRPVKLRVYDLKTKQSSLIATSVAKEFDPKWLTSTVLECNSVISNRRVRKIVRF